MDIIKVIKENWITLCPHIWRSWRNRRNLWKLQIAKLTWEEIGNVNRPTSTEEIKSIINNLPKQKKKEPGPDRFTGELYQTFKTKFIPICYNLL